MPNIYMYLPTVWPGVPIKLGVKICHNPSASCTCYPRVQLRLAYVGCYLVLRVCNSVRLRTVLALFVLVRVP